MEKYLETSEKSNYADRNYILKDLKNAREMTNRYNWTEVDITQKAIEETAAFIQSHLFDQQ